MALTATWEAVAEEIHGSDLDVNIAKVDCVTSKELCKAQQVRKFPVLQYYGVEKNDITPFDGPVTSSDQIAPSPNVLSKFRIFGFA
jgi:hypothetical protein